MWSGEGCENAHRDDGYTITSATNIGGGKSKTQVIKSLILRNLRLLNLKLKIASSQPSDKWKKLPD